MMIFGKVTAHIYDFSHIDQTLSKEKVKKMKDLYAYYHKKHYGYEKLYRGFRRKNFVCNLSAGKLIISAAVAGGITLEPRCHGNFNWCWSSFKNSR